MKGKRGRHYGSGSIINPKTASNDSEIGIVYGVMPIIEALRVSPRRIRKILVSEGRSDRRTEEIFELARAKGVPVSRVDREKVYEVVPAGVAHQGIAALVKNAEFMNSGDLIEKALQNPPATLLILDGIQDPRNLGAIIRTAVCSGVNGVFLPDRRSAGITDVAVKASAGAVSHIDIAKVANIKRLLEDLKSAGIWIVGSSGDAPLNFYDWDFTQPTAIVLGGEGKGMRRLTAEGCDALVRIPMCGTIGSLNVSVAAGVLLFESARQKFMQVT